VPGFSLEGAIAGRTGAAIGGDLVPERGVLADEPAAGRLRRVPHVVPLTFDQQSHLGLLGQCQFGGSAQVRVIEAPPSTSEAVPVTKAESSEAR